MNGWTVWKFVPTGPMRCDMITPTNLGLVKNTIICSMSLRAFQSASTGNEQFGQAGRSFAPQ